MMEARGDFKNSAGAPDESMDWFQAFSLLKSVGHSYPDICDMSPTEFRGYLRAAIWLRNKHLAENLQLQTLSSAAAYSGNDSLYKKINEMNEELTTAHKKL